MKYLKFPSKLFQLFCKNKRGNTLLLVTAAAIFATFGVYFFTSITDLSRKEKERITHLYNAYQMGISIEGEIQRRLESKGLEKKLQTDGGVDNYPITDFEQFTDFSSNDTYTLNEMIHEKFIVTGYDPTATRILGENTLYDQDNTTIKIVFDIGMDQVNADGVTIKTVSNIYYYVNLAGQPVPSDVDNRTFETNAPYEDGDPFYYIVSYADDDANLEIADITLQSNENGIYVYFLGVLDKTTNGSGPQPSIVVILPGDND